jgi:hypothetical protein
MRDNERRCSVCQPLHGVDANILEESVNDPAKRANRAITDLALSRVASRQRGKEYKASLTR